MIRAVLWKEWREQAAVVATLLVLGGGVLAAAVQLAGSPGDNSGNVGRTLLAGDVAPIAFVMLAMATGTVIGGTLFAGEEEAGTATFLATLPGGRWRFWRAKVLAGLLLTTVAGAVLIAEGIGVGAAGAGDVAAVWAGVIGLLIFASFGWGAFGSVRAKTSLAACGIGLLSAAAATIFFAIFAGIAAEMAGSLYGMSHGRIGGLPALAVIALLVMTPLPLSALLYVAPDWSRAAAEPVAAMAARSRRQARRVRGGDRDAGGWSGVGVWALLWLLFRQYLVSAAVLAGVGLALGLVMVAEPVPMVAAWPVVTLGFGAVVGVVGWADEQGRGVSRFWGERRLPAGRLWLAKVAAGLALTLGLSVLFLLPAGLGSAFGGSDKPPTVLPFPLLTNRPGWGLSSAVFWTFLWPVYGFVAGHLAGMLFRKTIVALAVAVLTGGTFAALWAPSVFAGGLHFWQFGAGPLAALLTARLLMRAWAADQLGRGRPLAGLVAGLLAVAGVTAGGLAWRVAEVPVIPESDDDLKFVKTIPSFEENVAGQEIRTGIAQFQRVDKAVLQREAGPRLFPDDMETTEPWSEVRPQFSTQIHQVLRRGWPADRPDLDAWMDAVFADKWDEPFYAAAKKPLGVVATPVDMDVYTLLGDVQELRAASVYLLARGLQKQAHGDPAAFVRSLDAVLAASRNCRNKSVTICMLIGAAIESVALSSVDRWLERLDGRPDLLRAAKDVLARHEATNPTDPNETWLAVRTIVRNMATNPSRWAGKYLEYNEPAALNLRPGTAATRARAELETNLIGFAWAVPWERERVARVVGLGNDPARQGDVLGLTRGAPDIFLFDRFGASRWSAREMENTAARRAATLRVALRLFQAETGKPATSLNQLVPKVLSAVPLDPFDGQPFRYRLSAGEWVELDVTRGARITIPPPPGPGADGSSPGLTQKQFDVVAAVGGGMTRFPMPLPGPPGAEVFEPTVSLEMGEGGSGMPGGGPPGLPDQPPAVSADEGFDLMAAVAGGLVQWTLPPLLPDLEGLNPGLGRRSADDHPTTEVRPGQGVLWSVGPDLLDHGGTTQTERVGFGRTGDLIWLVPLPAAPKP